MKDIPLDAATLATTLHLMAAGLRACRGFVGEQSQRSALENGVTQLGGLEAALGAGQDFSTVARAARAAVSEEKKLSEALAVEKRTRGLALMIEALVSYLEP